MKKTAKKMTISKDVTRIILAGLGIASLASLIYLAGPLIAIGNFRPFENPIIREITIVLLVAGAASLGGFKLFRRKKNAKVLAEGINEAEKKESDEVVLKDKMKDALATLKSASRGKKDYLYDLPWYLLIGPPGSGKTTALINSGLKFPLLRGTSPIAVAGVGGTRYCDWWFTEEAVLIDTAGRYTTQDFRCPGRQTKLVCLPRPPEKEPAAPADQRGDCRHQPRGFDDGERGRTRRTCRRDSRQAP